MLVLINLVNISVIGYFTYKPKPICDRCNVILISLDTLSALHLPCYGYDRNTAPNLCAFAKRNILFKNSYSASNWTLPSHFSIFTSLYPHVHDMTAALGPPLNEKYITLAQVFRQNGYQTIMNMVPDDELNLPLDRGIGRGFNIIQSPDDNLWTNSYSKLIQSVEQKRPFFAFFHTYFVHSPYTTGHEIKHKFTNQPEDPNIALTQEEFQATSSKFFQFVKDSVSSDSNAYLHLDTHGSEIIQEIMQTKNINDLRNLFYTLPSAVQWAFYNNYYFHWVNLQNTRQIDYLRGLYDEQIYNLDKKLQGLFDFINSNPKLKNNTIVIITADHGEEFMEHDTITHGGDLYKTNTLVPLIMRVPGIGPKVISDLVQGIDIYPTVLGLTGLSPISPIQGLDLSGLIGGKKSAKTNKFVISETTPGYQSIYAIQMANWRLYYFPTDGHKELYNLNLDPGEQNNIATTNASMVNALTKMLLTNEQN